MTQHNRHTALLPAPTCYGLVADLLLGSYGETGVMYFGKTCYGEVTNLLQTCYRFVVYVADLLRLVSNTMASSACLLLNTLY